MSSSVFRHFIRGSLALAFIGSHLTHSLVRLFPQRSARTALDRRTLRWFAPSSCKASAEGLPPSPAQHRFERAPTLSSLGVLSAFMAHHPAALVHDQAEFLARGELEARQGQGKGGELGPARSRAAGVEVGELLAADLVFAPQGELDAIDEAPGAERLGQ